MRNGKAVILLVEDDPLIGMVEKIQLEQYHYDIIHVTDGEAAIEAIRHHDDFDLVLMDIDLGKDMNGIETARHISKITDIPITFLSSHLEDDIITQTEQVTNYGYILKASGVIILDTCIKMALKLYNSNKKVLASEKILDKAFDVSHEAMSINDFHDNSRYIKCNQAFAALLGYPQEEIIGKTPIDLDLYVDLSERALIRKQIEEDGMIRNFCHKVRIRDGKIIDVRMNAVKEVIDGTCFLIVTSVNLQNT